MSVKIKASTKTPIDTKALSKKYKCNVNRLIKLWQNDHTDFEISQRLGIDLFKVLQVRQEITYLAERARHPRTNQNPRV